MADDLQMIVQRMIDAGESEENIATVIQGYQPPPSGPRADMDPLIHGKWADPSYQGESLGSVIGQVGGMALGGLASKLPWGRLLTTGTAAAKGGASKLPIVGPPVRAALKAGKEAWTASAPKAAPALKTAASGPKPKLSASEVASALRKEYGSAKAGQMLYGPARAGLKAADRQAAIKRLSGGPSQLPAAAKKAIDKELAASSASEAFDYASKAPNALAKDYFGEQLRQSLLQRMGR